MNNRIFIILLVITIIVAMVVEENQADETGTASPQGTKNRGQRRKKGRGGKGRGKGRKGKGDSNESHSWVTGYTGDVGTQRVTDHVNSAIFNAKHNLIQVLGDYGHNNAHHLTRLLVWII
ncbi:unnamed protein product [Medioppia subpectinata]|uniref:Uncharacterized protein n=1 Tax=Medioppia subpectinata TaxID=1979941 RepID=A0A7R9KCZ2_9ACAR|nr:unnamed protein product [Medioppia subpectinata]CAG2101217.1 unnamed protein product [Medioppia subpectinata]